MKDSTLCHYCGVQVCRVCYDKPPQKAEGARRRRKQESDYPLS